ncbi:HAD-like protein [Coniochaeta hoffmannii]|uniref:HAD-like protein n=1 Tax=Coniochaeta hoffmannii TaxID=91930 RepID=A0AA38RC87_9PEZI|nr:HAD-like protein [Coniochaeta hoffmannii]
MAKITTLLFDCDNTLVLSEELAFEGCADLLNQILELKHAPQPQPLTGTHLIVEFVGQNFRGMLLTLQQRYGFELGADELETYVRREEDVVIAKLKEALRPCPGVDDVLERLKGKYEYAVVSSSALRRVQASIEKVGQDKYFDKDKVFSAATSLPKPTSKPDPAIYLWALEKLGKKAEESVAVEDSKSGTLSATRAGIKVIGYVGPYEDDKKEEMEKLLKEAGAVVIMRDWSEFESCLKKIEAGEA